MSEDIFNKHKNYRAFISSEKQLLSTIEWNENKRPPRTGDKAFLLSRAGAVRVGTAWRWTLLKIGTECSLFRLFIAYRNDKMQLSVVLGKELSPRNHLILARMEYHPDHPGIHIHGCCEEVSSSAHGRLKYEEMKRFPKAGDYHRMCSLPQTDQGILNLVGTKFKIHDLITIENQLFLDYGV